MSDRSHKTRTLWLCGMLHALTHTYHVALLPLYLPIQKDLKLGSVEQATLLVTVLGLAYFVPSYPMGVLADRFSRKALLTTGLAINGLGFIGLSLAPNYPWALACVVVAGIGGSFYHPSATALVVGLFPEAKGRALGLVGIGASVGFFISPIYAGWRTVNAESWRAPVFELGVLGLVAAGVFVWLAEERRPRSSEGQHSRAAERMFPSAALWLLFLAAGLAFSLRDFAGCGMSTAASLFLQNAHGFNPQLTGLALSGIFIASAVSNPLFGGLSDRGRIRWISFTLLMAMLMMTAFPRAPKGGLVPVLLAYGFFFMASYPMVEAALMESVPESVRGRVYGLFITVSGLVGTLSHWVAGHWVEKLGPRATASASYYPLFGLLSLLVLVSLAGLPCLHAIRKREHVNGAVATAVPPLSALH